MAAPASLAQSQDQASLDVVSQDGDTIPIAREIIISSEGISIDKVRGDAGRIRTDARDGARIHIDFGDNDEHWSGYSRRGGPGV